MTSSGPSLDIRLVDYRDITHPEAGGAEQYLFEVFRRLVARGHRVRLLASRYPGATAKDDLDGIEVERRGGQMFFNFRALAACRRWSREADGEVVVESLCKIPLFTGRFGGGLPSLAIVFHLFGNTVFEQTNPLFGVYVRAFEAAVPAAYGGARMVVISETTQEDLLARGLRPGPIDLVHCGIDSERFQPEPSVVPESVPRLLYLGRLKRYKRIDLLLRAAARLRAEWPDLQVEVVGRGDHQPKLQQLAAELGLEDCINFTGFVSEEEKVDRLRRAHALVYTSPKEGWGISAIEASACGTPVVASDSPGLREAVRHGETGLLVPHGDLVALTEALGRLLREPGLRARLGAGGVRWAARFSWDRAADQVEQAVASAVREQQRA